MNLPSLINSIYGEVALTGLYSFEFVDKNRNTITEIFLMCPPNEKSVSESTRSSTVPTLSGGNYNLDAGNATKEMTISGDLYFPYVGSPLNPVARNSENLENPITGLEEFFKLRWMLVRYRDYAMTSGAKMDIPTTLFAVSPEITRLYKSVSKKVKNKTGALYDEIRLIVHDYDMDDHFYCRVNNFTGTQSSSRYIVANYNIALECYERDDVQKKVNQGSNSRRSTNESIDLTNVQLQQVDYDQAFEDIQAEIGFNASFASAALAINDGIEDINTENENIQSGKTTASNLLPLYTSNLLTALDICFTSFINTFLSAEQKADYESGDCTLDDLVDNDLLVFYNSLQKVKLQVESLQGILNSIVKVEEIRYSSNADDYTLTEEQFDLEESNNVENTTTFFFYTILDGDTARIIAQRELNDQEEFVKILKLNNISENDFIDGNLVGEKIKIPLPISVSARGEENLVYESDFTDSEKFFFGTDIQTTTDSKLQVSETGDLLAQTGIENAFDNVENRVLNAKGSLNVFQSNWGTISIDDGNAPLLVKIDRYLTDIVMQIQSDPRVEAVEMNLKKIEFSGESLSVPTKVFFIGTEETREVTV